MNHTANSIHEALKVLFPSPAHTLLQEVRNGTGYTRGPRTIDALCLSTWPSRGLWMAGIEIKTYLGDWRREIDNPEKAEAIAKYCHYWYAAVPFSIAEQVTQTLPKTWGLIVVKEKAKIAVEAERLTPKPPDFLLLCSIMRNFSESYVPKGMVDDLAAKKSADLEKHRAQELVRLKEDIAKFTKESGIDISQPWRYGDIGQAIKLIIESRILSSNSRLKALRHEADEIVKACDKILAAPSTVAV